MTLVDDFKTVNLLLSGADQHAVSLGDSTAGAEHLVLAALSLQEDSARALLGRDAGQFRAALVTTHTEALTAVGLTNMDADPGRAAFHDGLPRSEASLHEVFRRTRELAKQDRGLRGSHVILAAAEREHGTVARVLRTLGIDRESLL